MYMYMYMYLSIYIHVCMYVCMYVYICGVFLSDLGISRSSKLIYVCIDTHLVCPRMTHFSTGRYFNGDDHDKRWDVLTNPYHTTIYYL